MAIGYSRYLKTIYLIVDFFLLNLTFGLVSLYFKWPVLNADINFLVQFIYINLFWVISVSIIRVHEIDRGMRFEQIVAQLLRVIGFFSILLVSFLYFLDNYFIPVFHLEIKIIVWAIVFLIWRIIIALFINFLRRRGINYRKVIIVGNGQPAKEMMKFFENHPETGYRLKGVFCDESTLLEPHQVSGSVQDAVEFALAQKIDEIYCSLSGLDADAVTRMMNFADNNMIRFKVIPDYRGFLNRKIKIDFYDLVPVLSIRNEPLQNGFNRISKRLFDIAFSLMVIIIVFPLALLIFAPLIKLSSKGPVFFKQLRTGLNNQEFYCYKFRSMKLNDEADTLQARKGDERITKIGAFLRKTSLDELPQFYNALIGNMSIVGPRPHPLKLTEESSKLIDKFMVRHLVKPGVTGWAQVHGLRGETRDNTLMEKRVEYDVWYLENWSLLLDIKIVIITALQVISGKHSGD
ncbi:MAG: undecaprenyl-phosphate glucose phosphotransferase [Bacteroidetes bacterium]|jgi:putative colanic acid biosynthesis UDP-glucose lipid carrier transferase|nr:undecaprenyl-phosphate glucose phosphotransferase [Bacteroidota bacterium]MBK9319660.1 undecaprenyl-phosphate glucose phosphotransferase [Bacteroidota bacterium]